MMPAPSREPSTPPEPTFFVETGPRRTIVGPVPARAIWRALRVGSIDFQTLARPSRDAAWRPLAYWLGEAEANAAAAAEFDDSAPTIVRERPRAPLRSASVIELDLEPDEEDDAELLEAEQVEQPAPRATSRIVARAAPPRPSERPAPLPARTAPSLPAPAPRAPGWRSPPSLAATLRSMEDLRESRSPSLAPATSPSLPPPAPPERGRRPWLRLSAAALLVAGTVAGVASPAARSAVAGSLRGALSRLDRASEGPGGELAAAARSAERSRGSAAEETPDRDDELARALRRAETPPPPVILVQDPCDGLATGGKAICEWAGLVSVGADARRPSFGAIQAFLAASRVRHASGVVLERIAASREWPTHRVTVDWDHGYCLAAPDDRFGPGAEWAAWVVVQAKPLAAERCIPAETADFVGPLLELHERPVGPGAAALALRVRKELAAFAERHPAGG